ncbi:Glutaminyl-peptide cyclotransferase [Erysiphe neolycopersici]|uniref:Peptide hydrolase n=1 Tax=Erysiphe neolycopersici TaxID=212602 RepID=A0A420HDX7_9PEZI|nr:Glutaminyl-peptide cyclotransferase [Erysiphe neolycopersici]
MKTLLYLALLGLYTTLAAKAYAIFSDETIKNIPLPGEDFNINTGKILAPILIPRVSGTEGSTIVQQHFVNWFSTNLPSWKIEFQNSTSTTPVTGDRLVPFVNLIFTRDPPWARPGDVGRLVLAAHYDSKYDPPGFIGAIDSAAPCAILMYAARSIDKALTQKWATLQADGFNGLGEEQGIQILLLDGEESFLRWTDTDSLYGSRSLAEAWEKAPHAALSVYHNLLSSISMFVLLDLLGAPNTVIQSYFETTHWAYKNIASIETRMKTLGLMKSKPLSGVIFPDSSKTYFAPDLMIQDDHIPFMNRGVEILHLIPSHFPSVWHTMEDVGENLDIPTIEDLARIMTIFMGEWMELDGHFPKPTHMEWKKNEL